MVPTVYGIRNTGHYAHQVKNEDSGRRDEERGPFEDVKLCEISIFVGCFWGDCEVGVDASEYFQQALEDSEKVSRCAANDPELLVSPPIFNAHTAPPELKYSRWKDGNKKENEPDTGVVAYLPERKWLLLSGKCK